MSCVGKKYFFCFELINMIVLVSSDYFLERERERERDRRIIYVRARARYTELKIYFQKNHLSILFFAGFLCGILPHVICLAITRCVCRQRFFFITATTVLPVGGEQSGDFMFNFNF
jgi:hypothetical protein